MEEISDIELLGELVRTARQRRFGTVQAAIAASGLNRATWQRIEDGQTVRDDRLAAAEKSLGWDPGSARRILNGRVVEASIEPDGSLFMLEMKGTPVGQTPRPVGAGVDPGLLADAERLSDEEVQRVRDFIAGIRSGG